MEKNTLFIVLLTFVFLGKEVQAQTVDDFFSLQDKVEISLMGKDYSEAFKLSKQLLDFSKKQYKVNIKGKDTLVFCSPHTALLGHAIYYSSKANYDSMYYFLNIAVEQKMMDSYVFLNYFEEFYPIYNDKRTIEIKKQMVNNQIKYYGKSINKKLLVEIVEMFDNDQYQRKNYEYSEKVLKYSPLQLDSLKNIWIQVDEANQTRMVELLDKYGYIGRSLVGESDKNNAFFIIQHFPDLELQKKYLPILIEAGEKGEFSEELLKLIIDRINVREGKEQIYGTQRKVEGSEGVIIAE